MGILSNQKRKKLSDLSENDVEFLLTKLREAPYRGHEFEQFYNVWGILANYLKELKD